jgi:hypothetical protein
MKEPSMARALAAFPAVSPTPDQVATLERRLEDGYRRIEQAAREGKNVAAWETFWIELLRRYEALCDGLPEAQAA